MRASADNVQDDKVSERQHRAGDTRRTPPKQRWKWVLWGILAFSAVSVGSVLWLGAKASIIKAELTAATNLLPQLKDEVLRNDVSEATQTVRNLGNHTSIAREAANDPVWTLAGTIPWIGANFKAANEVATSADDVAMLGATPLVAVFQSLDWDSLAPDQDGISLEPLAAAKPKIIAAAQAVSQSADRLNSIDSAGLLPQVSEPLVEARTQLNSLKGGLNTAADAARIAPEMLGTNETKRYLLLIQNNAETRATGGIPGALAVLAVDKGKLSLSSQTSASAIGSFVPPVNVASEQEDIYSTRLGKFMQDVNLTPDFPTTAKTAQAMWERKTGEHLDGVVSIDPVALSYILDATGPVALEDPELQQIAATGMPLQLSSTNVVPTLLSAVYAKIPEPALQDQYFAGVASEIFGALAAGQGDDKALLDGVTKAATERRILLWSTTDSEQSIIADYPIGGSIDGSAISPAQFGVYFNDGTGAKMDYHVKRTAQLIEQCSNGDYAEITVRVTSTNTVSADDVLSLPDYVTGGGTFVPPGTVQSNIVMYGPVQANVETAMVNGEKIDFAANRHSKRPVGSVTVALAPGQTSTVDLTFGKIVQHTEPNLVVTPTVQPVKDVVLATQPAECVPGT